MQDQNGLKYLFVINPVSGGKEKQEWETSIRDSFKGQPDLIEFYTLAGKDDSISVKYHIDTIRPDKIIAVGGDGTVKMLAELMKDTEYVLGILPAGSANGMARELKIPEEVDGALKIIKEGVCRKIDLIRINEKHLCIHLSDIGLNALLVKYFERSEGRGMWGYARAVCKVMWGKQNIYAKVRTDSQSIQRKAYMIVIANASTYGTGAVINPKGSVDDGLFEVVLIRKISLWELFKTLVTHKPFDPEYIEVLQTKSLEMQTRKKTYFQVDGEYLGKTDFVNARILPQKLNVLLPVTAGSEMHGTGF